MYVKINAERMRKSEPDFFIKSTIFLSFSCYSYEKGCFIMSEEKVTMDDFSAELGFLPKKN